MKPRELIKGLQDLPDNLQEVDIEIVKSVKDIEGDTWARHDSYLFQMVIGEGEILLFDETDIAIKQLLKTYDYSAFAISILISSLQKHIEMNKDEFEFELKLKE